MPQICVRSCSRRSKSRELWSGLATTNLIQNWSLSSHRSRHQQSSCPQVQQTRHVVELFTWEMTDMNSTGEMNLLWTSARDKSERCSAASDKTVSKHHQ